MKGFTLVELMAVIIVLGIVALIVIPIADNFIKDNKQKSYDIQINNIKEGAKSWAIKNSHLLPDEGDSYDVTLLELKNGSFVESDIKDPKTNELFEDTLIITITKQNGSYECEIKNT